MPAIAKRLDTLCTFRNDAYSEDFTFWANPGDTIDFSASALSFAIGYHENRERTGFGTSTIARENIIEVTEVATTDGSITQTDAGNGLHPLQDVYPNQFADFVVLTVSIPKATVQAMPDPSDGRFKVLFSYDLQIDDLTQLYGDFTILESTGA